MQLNCKTKVNYDFINYLADMVIILSEDKIVDINAAMLKLLGGDKQEYIGVLLKNVMEMLEAFNENCEIQYSSVLQRNTGETVKLYYNISKINENESMLIVKRVEYLTEQISFNEYDLRSYPSKESYLWILETTLSSIFIINEKNKIVYANRTAMNLLNINCYVEIMGKEIEEVISLKMDKLETVYIEKEEALQRKDNTPFFEQKIIKKDNTEIAIIVSAIKYKDNGKKNTILLIRDITAQKQAVEDRINLEKALNYDRLRTELFSNLSHEFRTPINIILGTLQLMDAMHVKTECENSEVFSKYAKIMKQNSYRLLKLVNNLLDVTSIDSGQTIIKLKNGNIISDVEDVCQSVVEYADQRGITITFDTNVEEKIMAYDSVMLERIMLNLLSNAIKFNSDFGKIDINISDKKNNIIISVKDSGIGIPEDMKSKIFDKFTQVSELFTRGAEGSGTGLFLVKSLVEAHGGTISVESEIGKGSNFLVKLPVKILSEDEVESDFSRFLSQDTLERRDIELSDIYDII